MFTKIKLLLKPINNIACFPKSIRNSDSLINTIIACYTTTAKKDTDTANSGMVGAQVFLNYNQAQIEQILNTINNSSLDHLLRYDISKARASKLQSWIKKNGQIKRSQDLLEIDGLSVKMLQKFCNSVLSVKSDEHENLSANALRQRNAPFVTPSIGETQRQQIRSCTSIRIGVSSVSWARLELFDDNKTTPCLLTDWQHHEVSEKKLHLSDLIQRCLYIDHLIPTADCYLFENPQMAQVSTNPGNVDHQNVNIQKAQITAVLGFALSARRRLLEEMKERVEFQTDTDVAVSSTDKKQNKSKISKNEEILPNVFYLRRFLTARLFNHLIGTERVSSEQTIINLMRTFYNVEEMQDVLFDEEKQATGEASSNDTKEKFSFRGNLQFPQELRQMFSHAERYHREFLGQALLLNLAFVRLVLLQDEESIAIVTRSPNKKVELTS